MVNVAVAVDVDVDVDVAADVAVAVDVDVAVAFAVAVDVDVDVGFECSLLFEATPLPLSLAELKGARVASAASWLGVPQPVAAEVLAFANSQDADGTDDRYARTA